MRLEDIALAHSLAERRRHLLAMRDTGGLMSALKDLRLDRRTDVRDPVDHAMIELITPIATAELTRRIALVDAELAGIGVVVDD